jgi:hypothetical protein
MLVIVLHVWPRTGYENARTQQFRREQPICRFVKYAQRVMTYHKSEDSIADGRAIVELSEGTEQEKDHILLYTPLKSSDFAIAYF